MKERLDTQEFIRRSNIKHNNFYNYDKSVYVTAKIKVTITCPIHGDFEQIPDSHVRYGCKKCGLEATAKSKIQTFSQVLEKAKKSIIITTVTIRF